MPGRALSLIRRVQQCAHLLLRGYPMNARQGVVTHPARSAMRAPSPAWISNECPAGRCHTITSAWGASVAGVCGYPMNARQGVVTGGRCGSRGLRDGIGRWISNECPAGRCPVRVTTGVPMIATAWWISNDCPAGRCHWHAKHCRS